MRFLVSFALLLTLTSCNTPGDDTVVEKSENVETANATRDSSKEAKDIALSKLHDEIVMDFISKREGSDIMTQDFKLVVSALNRFLRSIKYDANSEKRLKVKKILKDYGPMILSGLVQKAFRLIAAGVDETTAEAALYENISQLFESIK